MFSEHTIFWVVMAVMIGLLILIIIGLTIPVLELIKLRKDLKKEKALTKQGLLFRIELISPLKDLESELVLETRDYGKVIKINDVGDVAFRYYPDSTDIKINNPNQGFIQKSNQDKKRILIEKIEALKLAT